MKRWVLEDIPWGDFNPENVDPEMLKVIKAAAVVEYNAADYAAYLKNVFHDDPNFQNRFDNWAEEEIQHGQALARWAELADPEFDFQASFQRFRDGYRVPVNIKKSVRGSRGAELIARCVVEMATSSYYTALGLATEEPVLKAICRYIAADEFRHHKLFYVNFNRYQKRERLSLLRRVWVAIDRLRETEDDELSYAYFATNSRGEPYDRRRCALAYSSRACGYYKPWQVERMVAMTFKTVGLKPHGRLTQMVAGVVWRFMASRQRLRDQVAA